MGTDPRRWLLELPAGAERQRRAAETPIAVPVPGCALARRVDLLGTLLGAGTFGTLMIAAEVADQSRCEWADAVTCDAGRVSN